MPEEMSARGGVYNLRNTTVCDFICRINEIIKYLENFLTFGSNQGLLEDEILELMVFLLARYF